MKTEQERARATTPSSTPQERGSRKPYASPELVVLGDLRDCTLGGSPGSGESGAPRTFRR